MMMSNEALHGDHDNWEPPFDSAFRSIAEANLSEVVLQRIKSRARALAENSKLQQLSTAPLAEDTRLASKPMRLRARLLSMALTSSALILLTFGVLFLSSSTQNQAYAQMVVRVSKLKAFFYYVCQVDGSKLDDLELVPKQKLMYMAPSYYRSTEISGLIQVSDVATKQSILLDMNRKEARRLTLPVGTDETSPLAFVEKLRSHFSKDRKSIQQLDKRVIEGREAIGFQSELHGEIVEAWLDPKTSLPLEVRLRAPTPNGIPANELATTWVVFTRFNYEADFDDKLFTVAVPDGYREVHTMSASIQALSDKFDRFASMLRKCAEHNDSVFPTSLEHSDAEGTCFAILAKYSLEWAAKREAAESFAEETKIAVAQVEAVKKFASVITEGLDFLKLPQDKLDFQYFPGSRLNQPDRPVAWFSPDGKETYKVLYSDLIVRDVRADALPMKPGE